MNQWSSFKFRMSSPPAQTQNLPSEDFLARVLDRTILKSGKKSQVEWLGYKKVVATSGVQDPYFGVQPSRIFGFFWIWIEYRFPFNRIRIRIIQMKKSGRTKILCGIIFL